MFLGLRQITLLVQDGNQRRKNMKRIASFILCLVLTGAMFLSLGTHFGVNQRNSFASTSVFRNEFGLDLSHSRWHDEKRINTTTLECDFADDSISVGLTRRASLQLRTIYDSGFSRT